MTNAQLSDQIEERMLTFSSNIINTLKSLPVNIENEIIKKQIIRSSSSVGANFIEANNASSKLDFKNKIYIAKKEASETRYWLKLLSTTNPGLALDTLLDECNQFIFILQKIVSSLKVAKLKV
jgi:four helix bundle protein